jgi:hypothetical protein
MAFPTAPTCLGRRRLCSALENLRLNYRIILNNLRRLLEVFTEPGAQASRLAN